MKKKNQLKKSLYRLRLINHALNISRSLFIPLMSLFIFMNLCTLTKSLRLLAFVYDASAYFTRQNVNISRLFNPPTPSMHSML